MTEGAERGTLRTGHMWIQEGSNGDEAVGLFREHGCLKDGNPSDESAFRQGWKLIPVVAESSLTEALKVAGELAVDYARHQSLCNGALGGRCTCGLDDKRAALERIRNNKH